MKKGTFFTAALCLIGAIAFAQPLANHIYLSGSVGMGSQWGETTVGNVTNDNAKTFSYTFRPTVGYTISDRLMLGIEGGVSGSNTDYPDNSEINNTTFGIGAFGRYYIPISERFFFFPHIGTGIENSKRVMSGNNTPDVESPISNTFYVGVRPGLAYYPSTHWSIELFVGDLRYSHTTTDDLNYPIGPDREIKTNNFGFNLSGASVMLGVGYLIQL